MYEWDFFPSSWIALLLFDCGSTLLDLTIRPCMRQSNSVALEVLTCLLLGWNSWPVAWNAITLRSSVQKGAGVCSVVEADQNAIPEQLLKHFEKFIMLPNHYITLSLKGKKFISMELFRAQIAIDKYEISINTKFMDRGVHMLTFSQTVLSNLIRTEILKLAPLLEFCPQRHTVSRLMMAPHWTHPHHHFQDSHGQHLSGSYMFQPSIL